MLIKLIISVIISFAIGCIIGVRLNRVFSNTNPDGYIYLDKNEDGDDRITFQLGMEYDDISKYESIVFDVIRR